MDGDRTQAVVPKEGAHEVSVTLAAAKGQRARAAVATELGQRIVGARLDSQGRLERAGVEAAVAPGGVAVVDQVGHAVLPERAQQLAGDAGQQVTAVGQVLPAERQQVGAVAAVGRGGEGQQKARLEVLDEALVGRRGGVMKLVHHQVVERVRVRPSVARGRTLRKVSRACVRISSRWATNRTRWNGRLSKAAR